MIAKRRGELCDQRAVKKKKKFNLRAQRSFELLISSMFDAASTAQISYLMTFCRFKCRGGNCVFSISRA